MIKNFENFINDSERVNEGFMDNVFDALDAGIRAFKMSKSQDKAIEKEERKIMMGETEVSAETQLAVLVSRLMRKTGAFAENFAKHTLESDINTANVRLVDIEEVIAKIKELLPLYCKEK